MSNPSGSDHDDGTETADAARYQPAANFDPVTEVIDIADDNADDNVADAVVAAEATGERRYTAPGFDAGSTQIIDRVPDDETEYIAAPTEVFAAGAQPRTATPQAISPREAQRPSWLIPIIVVLAALAAAGILGLVLLQRANSAQAAKEQAVRSTIQTFDTAVRDGDLATLRTVTCGRTRDDYVAYDDAAWADAYSRVSAAKQYPVVASIDELVIEGDHAEANVTSYMAFDPATTSTRSFDLQFRDDQWKICQSS